MYLITCSSKHSAEWQSWHTCWVDVIWKWSRKGQLPDRGTYNKTTCISNIPMSTHHSPYRIVSSWWSSTLWFSVWHVKRCENKINSIFNQNNIGTKKTAERTRTMRGREVCPRGCPVFRPFPETFRVSVFSTSKWGGWSACACDIFSRETDAAWRRQHPNYWRQRSVADTRVSAAADDLRETACERARERERRRECSRARPCHRPLTRHESPAERKGVRWSKSLLQLIIPMITQYYRYSSRANSIGFLMAESHRGIRLTV